MTVSGYVMEVYVELARLRWMRSATVAMLRRKWHVLIEAKRKTAGIGSAASIASKPVGEPMTVAHIIASRPVTLKIKPILIVHDRLTPSVTVPVARQAWQSLMSARGRLAQIPFQVVRSSAARL